MARPELARAYKRVWRGVLAAALVAAVQWAGAMVALGQEAVARISSPQPGAVVHGTVLITGTAIHPRFSFYKVEYAAEPSANWVVIGDLVRTQVQDGVLLQWDTRAVPDGSYSLRLVVVDETGNYIEAVVRQIAVQNAAPLPTETPTPTETATPTPPVETPTPTSLPTVEVLITRVASPTTLLAFTVTPVARPSTASSSNLGSGLADSLSELASGVAREMLAQLGLDFRGLGAAVVRGAVFALGTFAIVGFLALLKQALSALIRLLTR